MIAIGCDKVSKAYGVDTVLDDITFSLEEGDKLGIVGVNGAGKTTLINIICGRISEFGGKVYTAKDSSIGVLAQQTEFYSERTVYDEALSVFSELTQTEAKLEKLERLIESGDIDAASEYGALYEKFKVSGGLEYKARTRSTLMSLGFSEKALSQRVPNMSGGQKTVISLAKLLLKNHDILILDEPTNHLDMKALAWLEKFIYNYPKTVIIISHDRYFLDKCTTKTLEISYGKCKLYNCGYSGFVKQREKDAEIIKRHYENQQREIERLRAFIEQQRRWNRERNIIAAESREKAIGRMKLVEAPEKEHERIKLKFAEAPECANDVIEACDLSKSFGEKKLFSHVSFLINRGDRVFILGENGAGKSTLMKILTGILKPDSGEVLFGNRVEMSYYDQEYQGLDPSNTVLDELYNASESGLSLTKIRMILGSFLFTGDDVFKKVSELSGGEKARLTFAKLVLKPSNLLLLDEPTNHLDINTREVLENALCEYSGTILAVSHDRYFIKRLAKRILYFDGSAVNDYKMDFDTFEEYMSSGATVPLTQSAVCQSAGAGKGAYLENKRRKSELLKKKTRYEKLTSLIDESETVLLKLNEELSDPDTSFDYKRVAEITKEIERITKESDGYYAEWDALDKELKEI